MSGLTTYSIWWGKGSDKWSGSWLEGIKNTMCSLCHNLSMQGLPAEWDARIKNDKNKHDLLNFCSMPFTVGNALTLLLQITVTTCPGFPRTV